MIKTWLNYNGKEITRSYLNASKNIEVHYMGSSARYFCNKMTRNPVRNSKYIKELSIIDCNTLDAELKKLLQI